MKFTLLIHLKKLDMCSVLNISKKNNENIIKPTDSCDSDDVDLAHCSELSVLYKTILIIIRVGRVGVILLRCILTTHALYLRS